MRVRPFLILVSLVILSGCGRGSSLEGAYLFDAMDAFKSGDRGALQATIAKLDTVLAQSTSADTCSPEAYARRRVALYRRVLGDTYRSDAMRLSEEARLVYFQAAAVRQLADGDTFDAKTLCGNHEGWFELVKGDAITKVGDVQSLVYRWIDWRKDLGYRCGAEWDARIAKARTTLRQAGLPSSFEGG